MTNTQLKLLREWADATRGGKWEEVHEVWKRLMEEWLKPVVVNQEFHNKQLDRMMRALERIDRRLDDAEWDKQHGDINQ
jgi:hypothetical protein